MRLAQVLDPLAVAPHDDLEISNVQIDSRECERGSLFFAMPGANDNGARFIGEAVARGAVAVISSSAHATSVPTLTVPATSLHELLVRASAQVTAHPENGLTLVGVTGTNGKTSVTTVLAALWSALGRASDVIGTLTHVRTTPAPPELYRELARFASTARGRRDPLVALEVSSHALSQGRVDGLVFDVAVFTNLSLDHLDYHQTLEEYFAAKATLFTPERCRRAVVWADDEFGRRLLRSVSVPVIEVHRDEATDVHMTIGSTDFLWRGHRVEVPLSGEFNLDNVLLVLAVAEALGVPSGEAAAAIATVAPVPGRFEVVRNESPTVVVDYAHTPDGLERLLGDVRRLRNKGRVIVVFGCGGERDRSKRPLMGEIATRLADVSIVTSDNPRNEDPDSIIDEIVAGCHSNTQWRRLRDRRLAIGEALAIAEPGDVVVIAGKGHERTQVVGNTIIEFDDRAVAREFLG